MPIRIQRRRTKGWRMPEGAVYVGRPSLWGNPFAFRTRSGLARVPAVDGSPWEYEDRVSADGARHDVVIGDHHSVHHVRYMTRAECVEVFRTAVATPTVQLHVSLGPGRWLTTTEIRTALAGRNLACWCRLDQPCHADVLLDLANGGAS